ncbi:MAG: tyrosine-type recombinase/integrase [Melioribacteraceae bacterium]
MEEILKNITVEDLEKFKALFSIMPGNAPKEVVTLRVFRDEYLNLIKNSRSKSYYISVNSSFDHLADYLNNQFPINSIQAKDIENFLIHIQKKVKKGYRVYYRTLKAAFNKAVEWGYVNVNHFQRVKLPKKQQVNPAYINSDELQAISNKVTNKTVKDLIVFGFYTGMRLNEIINLTWRNVDLSAKVITVGDDKFTTKGRNQRYIPICEEAFEILVRREGSNVKSETRSVNGSIPHDSKPVTRLIRLNQTVGNPLTTGSLRVTNGFVFCKDNEKRFTGDYISKRFKLACKAAGVDQSIHFHSLRHSFASNLVQKGVPLYTIKELLGHSSISTTEIYSHLNMVSLREAVEKLDTPKQPSPFVPLPGGEISTVKIYSINSGEKR